MGIQVLLFLTLLVCTILYIAARFGRLRGKQGIVVTLSWSVAVFGMLYVGSLLAGCTTDRSPQKTIYVVAAGLLVANAILDTALFSENKLPVVPRSSCVVRMVGLSVVAVTLAAYGMIRTSMYTSCISTKSFIKGSYAAVRDPDMPRAEKIAIAEHLIRSMGLSPGKTKRILRL